MLAVIFWPCVLRVVDEDVHQTGEKIDWQQRGTCILGYFLYLLLIPPAYLIS